MSKDPSRPKPDPEKVIGKVSKQANEATEMDLWDMDFNQESVPSPSETVQPSSGRLPAQRKSASRIKTKKPTELKPKSPDAEEPTVLEPVSDGFTELAPESEVPAGPVADEVAAIPEAETRPEAGDDVFADFPEIEQTEPDKEWEESEDIPAARKDQEAAPVMPSIGSLSKLEKIAISALCAVLALGATLTLIHFSSRVPTRPLIAEDIDFPVSGKIVEIKEASTYWREPVTTGENADVVRRDTKLIPVLKLNLSAKSGAIRVFFRNDEGLVVGDGITRTVKGDAEVTVAATAGFEDVGMHTAYRTGDGNRWIVQVFEAPEATSPREKFRKVLEMDISTQIR